MLVNWLRYYYHRVYSLDEDERPPEDMVNYDLLLDEWLEARDLQRKQKMKKSGQDNFQMAQ
jgi:hypothetical protein